MDNNLKEVQNSKEPNNLALWRFSPSFNLDFHEILIYWYMVVPKSFSVFFTLKSCVPTNRILELTNVPPTKFQTWWSRALHLRPLWICLCCNIPLFQENASWHIPHVNGLLLICECGYVSPTHHYERNTCYIPHMCTASHQCASSCAEISTHSERNLCYTHHR
jgi:hypothetical protein